MRLAYLLIAGIPVSIVHCYLVWRHRDNRKFSVSEHAILDKGSYSLYVGVHLLTVIFFSLFSYNFFIVEHSLPWAFVLNVIFAVLDIVQAIVPSRDRAEMVHTLAAYISWLCYVASGLLALMVIDVAEPFKVLAGTIMAIVLLLFLYMHLNRSKLYPYQLLMVPLYVLAMSLIVIGV